jgi:DNA-binding transcriptional LysR family regulator
VRVLDDFCPPFPGYFLYYPSRAHVSPKLKAFVEFMRHRERGWKARAPERSRARKRPGRAPSVSR